MEEADFRSILGKNIQRYRKKLGLTQEKASEKAGISPGHFADIVNMRRWPSPSIIIRLAEALQVEPYELFIPEEVPEQVRRDQARSFATNVKEGVNLSIDERLKAFLRGYEENNEAEP